MQKTCYNCSFFFRELNGSPFGECKIYDQVCTLKNGDCSGFKILSNNDLKEEE